MSEALRSDLVSDEPDTEVFHLVERREPFDRFAPTIAHCEPPKVGGLRASEHPATQVAARRRLCIACQHAETSRGA